MPDTKNEYEVIVIGGGPAGATAGTILAQHGRDVLLLEKDAFPRFHIGESLMPMTFGTFERLGVLDKMRGSPFVRKESVQFVNSEGKQSQPFYFLQTHPHESSRTWQVLRSEFDRMLLDNARDKGVQVRERCAVNDVLFDGPRAVGVKLRAADGTSGEVGCRVVVDATGVNALLIRKLGILRPDPKLRKASLFAHYKGAARDSGRDEGATVILHTRDHKGWFWFLPLPDDTASIGVVCDLEYLFDGRERDPLKLFEEEITRCPGIEKRLANATRVTDVRVLKDFSYSASQCAGDGWVLIGDALGFLDPIYSSGVLLALVSGERAADAIHEALAADDVCGARLATWGADYYRGVQAVRKLIYAFYTDGFSFGKFMRANPDQLRNLVGLLIGDIFDSQASDVLDVMAKTCDLPEPLRLDDPRPIVPRSKAASE